jgi:hypothetical protein
MVWEEDGSLRGARPPLPQSSSACGKGALGGAVTGIRSFFLSYINRLFTLEGANSVRFLGFVEIDEAAELPG